MKMLPLLLIIPMLALTSANAQGTKSDGMPQQADPKSYLAEVREAMTVQWPKNHTMNIVCHGHSVPSGYFKTPLVDTFNSYPYLLHHALKEQYPYAVVNVILTSKGGENSESGEKRFAKDVLSMHPDVVTIDYSLNDRGMGLARSEAAWRSMIAAAKQQGVKVLLLTPTPDEKANLDDPNDPLVQHAEQVRQLARENGVGLVDSLAAFQAALRGGTKLHDLMAQSNHPNRLGHDLVVKELMPWFEKPAASLGQSQTGASQGTPH
jgi:lysophospholipase L1-like esterase